MLDLTRAIRLHILTSRASFPEDDYVHVVLSESATSDSQLEIGPKFTGVPQGATAAAADTSKLDHANPMVFSGTLRYTRIVTDGSESALTRRDSS